MAPPNDNLRFAESGSVAPPAWIEPPLLWQQTGWRDRAWELTSAGKRVAFMRSRGMVRQAWEVEGPSGAWRFNTRWTGRTGIFHGGDEAATALYEPGWWGRGPITMASGEVYRWKLAGLFSRTWLISTDSGFPVLRIASRTGFLRFGGRVEIEEAGRRLRDLEALVLIGWRLALLAHRHTSHAAAG